jgi:trehalose synthase
MAPRLVHVSTSKTIGGVAEVVASEIAHTGPGVDVEWVNPAKDQPVNAIGMLLNAALYGAGVQAELRDRPPWPALRRWADAEGTRLAAEVGPADAVFLHDPLCLALAPAFRGSAGTVLWRCHVGDDGEHPDARAATEALRPYLDAVDVQCFLRGSFVWPGLDPDRTLVVPPGIDPDSPKNRELPAAGLAGPLLTAGRLGAEPVVEDNGTGFLPAADTPYVLQVSRWDPLKGFPGVLRGFAGLAGEPDVELVLLGPHVDPGQHHPDNTRVRAELLAGRAALPERLRRRVHVWSFARCGRTEEATAVNLLQRQATVVAQNSLREGFGLTVTEAMWKHATVLGAAVGGIRDQIEDGRNGLLSAETGGGPAWTDRLAEALRDAAARDGWGRAARATVRERFLASGGVRRQFAALGWDVPAAAG